MAETMVPTKGRSVAGIVRSVAVAALVIAVIVGAFYFATKKPTVTVTAHFTSAVGVYEGSDVRVLGVRIGTITKITPHVDNIEVTMVYDAAYKVPANATAVVVPPSVVSDRYVQFTPAYTAGPVLATGADIPITRTEAPVELDDLYKAMSDLSVALGPSAQNPTGAMNQLIQITNQDLAGNGAKLGQTFQDLSKAAKTFADNRTDLFGTITNLNTFTTALAANDAQVSQFDTLLAEVSGSLAGERQSLALAIKNLATALSDINTFINNNQQSIRTSVSGLKDLTSTLVSEQASLNEILQVVPVGISNITHAYNPTTGVFDAAGATNGNTRATNAGAESDPLVPGVPDHLGGVSPRK